MKDIQPDLADLLARCAARDRAALRDLFEAEGARMTGIAMRVLHRIELAEEAVQEAFLQVWRNAGRYDSSLGSPRAWLYTIVRFRAIDILRSRPQEETHAPEDLDRLRDRAVDDSWDGLDPEGRLHHCLTRIDARQRRTLLLAYVAGLTQAEIAGKLGAPLGTVKSWARRGLDALLACLR